MDDAEVREESSPGSDPDVKPTTTSVPRVVCGALEFFLGAATMPIGVSSVPFLLPTVTLIVGGIVLVSSARSRGPIAWVVAAASLAFYIYPWYELNRYIGGGV